MSLLTLKDIGKIYVSEGNVAVGIRGVNLSFDKGEFVAITGKSGSGKSTLLNVISGMDTYEEGELYVEDAPTSHYLQPDWEEYRKQYISYIFQDYNIIESYTVLQNVELALMHIEDKKKRRKRALELLTRVGLSEHLHHKGSKLSGGQKQRTVIARALAKDSPIILADEPTGNLDSATSAEIIELLKEVSKDKLLIVVTHNFEQVENHATRHIRIFDGAVESDHTLRPKEIAPSEAVDSPIINYSHSIKSNIKNGVTLGSTIFRATPKLSFFLCILLIIGTFGVYLATALSADSISDLFESPTMFTHIDGRLVVTSRGDETLNLEKVKQLAAETGAQSYLRIDSLLDDYGTGIQFDIRFTRIKLSYNENVGVDIGREPQAVNEVLLYLPISFKPEVGEDQLKVGTVNLFNTDVNVVGVKYFIDNNLIPKAILTAEGFEFMTAVSNIYNKGDLQLQLAIMTDDKNHEIYGFSSYEFTFDFSSDDETIHIGKHFGSKFQDIEKVSGEFVYTTYDYYNGNKGSSRFTVPEGNIKLSNDYGGVTISAKYIAKILAECLDSSYNQASLFYPSDAEAAIAAEKLNSMGYVAVTSDTEYTPNPYETIEATIIGIIMLGLWFGIISFLVVFLTLCSKRALAAFKGDMAIMRSMGIPVAVIKIGMYFRMLLSLIPSIILVIAAALVLYRIPQINGFLTYLYPWQYALMFIGMLLLTLMITNGHIKRLFNESVKKSLKGGEGN